MLRVELFGVASHERMDVALAIRRSVFVDEQGVPLEEEIDEHDLTDGAAVHALAYANGMAVGTGRFYEAEPSCAQIGRMAVLADRRNAGVGRALLDALIAEAQARGFTTGRLLAQVRAVPFYERVGFRLSGEPLWDGGILHRPMQAVWKKVSEPAGKKQPRVDGTGGS